MSELLATVDNDFLMQENFSLKQQLKTKEQLLKQKSEELQSYLYTVAHELKTPIISMRGYTMLLQEFYLANLNGEIRNYLERIVTNLDQMDDLIINLIDYTRIDVNADECEQVNINDLLREALEELEFLMHQRDYEIKISFDLPTVFSKRNLMLRVFTNLLNNAIKYSKDSEHPVI
ncbi:HAMP domain-containing histidine kinase, partial [candidate division KSB1 bacterium]|nr:HAMP domain-containing histidine kinase [candidate division KSB1 bacterium]